MKKTKLEKLKEINIDIRKSFGKFYLFSIIIDLFLILLAFLIAKLDLWFIVLLFVFIIIFYLFMIRDLYKNKSRYWTTLTSILILIFILLMTMDILKFVFFLIK